MDANLAERILRLPTHIRAVLATVEEPGWYVVPGERGPVWSPYGEMPYADRALHRGSAWWSANPARSVAAVTSMPSWWAYQRIADWLYDREPDADDHAAALSIIEAHVARSTP